MLTAILKPEFDKKMEATVWREHYTEVLADVDHYEFVAGCTVDSSVNIAVVVENAPGYVQTHLQVADAMYGGGGFDLPSTTRRHGSLP